MNTDVVGRGRDGDRSGAPDVGVAQLVGQLLQLVSIEMIIIPQHVVVTWPRRALDTCNGGGSLLSSVVLSNISH